jgi:hypothetical protein
VTFDDIIAQQTAVVNKIIPKELQQALNVTLAGVIESAAREYIGHRLSVSEPMRKRLAPQYPREVTQWPPSFERPGQPSEKLASDTGPEVISDHAPFA